MKKLKLFLACMLMTIFSIGQVWATEESVDVTPANALNDGGVDPITIACAKGDGTSNPAISSGQLRLYQAGSGKTTGNTITFSSTYAITKIEFTFANSMTADNGSFSDGTYDSGTTTWTGSTNSLTLTVTGTSSSTRIYITAMKVYYDTGGGTPTCATPTFTPAAGSYEGTQNVTISSTDGATIYYTTDGSTPTTSSSVYSSAIPVSADMTIKAYAVKTDYNDSEVATAAYTITEGPDVTIAFEGNTDWDIPSGSGNKTVDEGTYTDGTYTIKIAGSTGEGYYINGYLILGKTGAYVELPEFSSPIEKIVVVGTSGGSTGVKFNIYDGTTAVSTEVTGCKNVEQEFEIENPAANKVYTITVTSNANLQISKIKIFFGAASAVAKPVISGQTPFVNSTTVTITAEDGAEIRYTTDGSDPTSGSTLYEGAFNITEACTVKAIAIKDGYDNSAVASKAFATIEVLTVAQARTAIDAGGDLSNKYVRGIIYRIDSYNSTYHSLTYWISDNGVDNANPLEVYSGKGIEGADFSGLSDLNVGDKVIVVGTLKKYNSVYEFDKNNELVERTVAALQSVAVSGTPDLVKYGEGQAFDPTGLVVTATYNTGYASVVTEDIEWNATPSTITASGNVSVTATWGGKTSAAYEVAVTLAEQAPSFSVAAGEYFEAQEIALTAATGAAIYYTLDGTEPTSASTLYENPISLSERATTTIKALAIGEHGESQVVSATYNINLPYSIVEAIALIPDAGDSRDNTCVDGVIYKVDFFSETSKYITYWITTNGLEQDSLKIYKGKGISGADFASADDLVVGDAVRVYGQLLNYNGTPEINEGNHLISYTAKTLADVQVDGAVTKTEYNKGEAFAFNGLQAHAIYDTYYMEDIPFDEVVWTADPATITKDTVVEVGASWHSVSCGYIAPVAVTLKKYAVTISTPENGSIVVKNNGVAIESGDEVKDGTVLTVVTEADDYYRLATLTANETDIKEAGQFTVNAAAVTVTATFEAQPVQLLGDLGGAGWDDGILFSETANPEIRTLTLTDLAVGTYSFKLKVNGEWRSNAATFKRSYQGANDISGNESNNMTLVVDKAGDYTLTWRFSNESLGFTFPTRDYTLVGVSALTGGYNWGDGLNVEANLLTNVEGGFYRIVKEDLLLAVGSYEYQIARDHDWRGVSNSILSIATSGRYNVTFTFNENGEETNAVAELQEELVILSTIQAAGEWNVDSEWHWIYNDFEPAANKQTASYKVTIDAGDYKFKMINNSNWLGNGANITRAANSATLTANGDDMVLKADVSGEYTFTWTYETNTLVVTFPMVEPELSWNGVDGNNRAWAYMQGKEFTLPTLNNPHDVDVTYSCEDGAGIITINEGTGAITLVSEGAVHITATSAATSVYLAGTATYTLYVCGVTMLTIGGDATTKEYEYGEAFERDGLTATATYNNGGGTLDVTELATWTISPETITSSGSVSVTASYASQSDQKYVYDVKVKTHAVTWTSPEHGSLTVRDDTYNPFASGTKFRKGRTCTVEAEPAAGYKLQTLTANGEDISSTKEFTIGTEDVEIVVSFVLNQPTALDNAEAGEKAQKIMLNNQLFILRGGKIYDAQGKLVK